MAAVEAAVELLLAAGPPFVGAGVGEAQDRVPAQPAHRVQVQRPHPLHEGAAGVAAVDGHPARTQDFPGPGLDRLLQQGQGHSAGRVPAGVGPARLPARADGARGLAGAEGVGAALLDVHGRQQRNLQSPAGGAGHAARNQPVPQVASPLLVTKLASRASSAPRPSGTRGCAAPSAATARRAKGKGRANQRAWVRADRPP